MSRITLEQELINVNTSIRSLLFYHNLESVVIAIIFNMNLDRLTRGVKSLSLQKYRSNPNKCNGFLKNQQFITSACDKFSALFIVNASD